MPTLAAVRSAVDARLADLWTNQIVPRQETYASNHGGRYWQGILCIDLANLPDNLPAAPAVLEAVPDLTRKPADQATSWLASGIALGATIPMAIAIDVYDGPAGTGYVGTVWAKHNGTIYSRAQATGPEAAERTFAWRAVG